MPQTPTLWQSATPFQAGATTSRDARVIGLADGGYLIAAEGGGTIDWTTEVGDTLRVRSYDISGVPGGISAFRMNLDAGIDATDLALLSDGVVLAYSLHEFRSDIVTDVFEGAAQGFSAGEGSSDVPGDPQASSAHVTGLADGSYVVSYLDYVTDRRLI